MRPPRAHPTKPDSKTKNPAADEKNILTAYREVGVCAQPVPTRGRGRGRGALAGGARERDALACTTCNAQGMERAALVGGLCEGAQEECVLRNDARDEGRANEAKRNCGVFRPALAAEEWGVERKLLPVLSEGMQLALEQCDVTGQTDVEMCRRCWRRWLDRDHLSLWT